MERRLLGGMAVAAALLPAGVARADTPPPGALSALPGAGSCVLVSNFAQGPGGPCVLFRTSAGSAACGNCVRNAVMSPDGLDVYVAEGGSSTIVDLRRDAASGQIAQAAGTAGCVSGSGRNGCARGRGLTGARRRHGQPPFPDLFRIAISPDGRNVYAAASSDIGKPEAATVLAFARDPATGALTQLPGRAGCLSDTDPACTPGRSMEFATGVAVSPDGDNVYVETASSRTQVAVLRRLPGGSLRQLAGRNGCVGSARRPRCVKPGTPGEGALALSPDGRNAYLASSSSDDISVYARVPGTGALRLAQRCIPYQRDRPCGRTDSDQFISTTVSPDGTSFYLVEGVDDRIVAFARDPATGGLTRLPGPFGCGRSTPCPGGLTAAQRVSVAGDGQTAYYTLGSGRDGGGIVLYHRGADGALSPFDAPFACVAGGGSDCQIAPGLKSNADRVLLSPDGRFAYAVTDGGVVGLAVGG